MEVFMKPTRYGLIGFLILGLGLFGFLQAQIEEDVEVPEKCSPDTLTTGYDQLKDPNIPVDELKKWYSFGSEYYKNKNYESAIPYLWRVFLNDTTKNCFNAVRKLAECYFNLQYVDSTLIVCYRGLEKFPNNVTLHYYAGYLQDNLRRYRCAIPHYEALVEDQPRTAEYLSKLAFLYYKDENAKAIDVQKQLVALNPANMEYTQTLATYNDHFLSTAEVIETWRQAYINNPDNIDAALKYGKAAYEAGDYKEALAPLNSVLKKDPKNIEALNFRAMDYESLENYTAAINDYKKILELDPQNAEIMCGIANNYKNMNQFSNGKYWVGRALSAKPGFGLANIKMAEIYEQAVNYCTNTEKRGRKYDDGLVYELAYREYDKAQNDPMYKNLARSRMTSLKTVLLTDEEKFMNQNRKTLKLECYTSWIN
jgi:tetratricopeptide (TPR) repeat protein